MNTSSNVPLSRQLFQTHPDSFDIETLVRYIEANSKVNKALLHNHIMQRLLSTNRPRGHNQMLKTAILLHNLNKIMRSTHQNERDNVKRTLGMQVPKRNKPRLQFDNAGKIKEMIKDASKHRFITPDNAVMLYQHAWITPNTNTQALVKLRNRINTLRKTTTPN